MISFEPSLKWHQIFHSLSWFRFHGMHGNRSKSHCLTIFHVSTNFSDLLHRCTFYMRKGPRTTKLMTISAVLFVNLDCHHTSTIHTVHMKSEFGFIIKPPNFGFPTAHKASTDADAFQWQSWLHFLSILWWLVWILDCCLCRVSVPDLYQMYIWNQGVFVDHAK